MAAIEERKKLARKELARRELEKRGISTLESAVSKAEGISEQPPLGERLIGRFQAALPAAGQFVGGIGGGFLGSRVKAPVRGQIVGGTVGRFGGRVAQLGISQFKENPKQFLKNLAKGETVLSQATPEQRKFLGQEVLTALSSEVLTGGFGKLLSGAVRGVGGELLGERVAERGFKKGFKRLTAKKFKSGRVPQDIGRKSGQFFNKATEVAGKGVNNAINKPGVGDQLVAPELLETGLRDIETNLGRIEDLGDAVSPAQKKLLLNQINGIKSLIRKDILTGRRPSAGVTIKDLWETRKKLDKVLFSKGFAPEGKQYLQTLRKLLNDPIRNSSEEVAENFSRYSFVKDLQDEVASKLEVRELGDEIFASKTEKFASTLLNTSKDDAIAELKIIDAMLEADDRVIEDLLDLASAEQLSKKVGTVGLPGRVISGVAGGRRGLAGAFQTGQTLPARALRTGINRSAPTAITDALVEEEQ